MMTRSITCLAAVVMLSCLAAAATAAPVPAPTDNPLTGWSRDPTGSSMMTTLFYGRGTLCMHSYKNSAGVEELIIGACGPDNLLLYYNPKTMAIKAVSHYGQPLGGCVTDGGSFKAGKSAPSGPPVVLPCAATLGDSQKWYMVRMPKDSMGQSVAVLRCKSGMCFKDAPNGFTTVKCGDKNEVQIYA